MSEMKQITLRTLESAAVSAYRHQKKVYGRAKKLMDMYEGIIAAEVKENCGWYLVWDNENLPEALKCEISNIRSDGKHICSCCDEAWENLYFSVRGIIVGDDEFKGLFYEETFDKLFSKIVGIVKYIENVPHLVNEDKLERCRSHYDATRSDTFRESYFQSLFNKLLTDKLNHLPDKEYVLKHKVRLINRDRWRWSNRYSPGQVCDVFHGVLLESLKLDDKGRLYALLYEEDYTWKEVSVRMDGLHAADGICYSFDGSTYDTCDPEGFCNSFYEMDPSRYRWMVRTSSSFINPWFDRMENTLAENCMNMIPIQYEMRKEDGLYRFYRDGELLLTPLGVIVETSNKSLAEKILSDLNEVGYDFVRTDVFVIHCMYLDSIHGKEKAPVEFDAELLRHDLLDRKNVIYVLEENEKKRKEFEEVGMTSDKYDGMLVSSEYERSLKKFAESLTRWQLFVEAVIRCQCTGWGGCGLGLDTSFYFYSGQDGDDVLEKLASYDEVLAFDKSLRFYFHLESV